MPTPIIMPKFEMSQETGTIARWLKKNGDVIAKGDPILEVETDKITMEVESPTAGTLSGITAQPGDVIPIGQVIAQVLKQGEAAAEDGGRPTADGRSTAPVEIAAPADTESKRPSAVRQPALSLTKGRSSSAATPVAEKMAAEHGLVLADVAGSGKDGQITKADVEAAITARRQATASNGAVRAVPAARRLARELNVDLATVTGSGPNARIQSSDVERAAAARHETGMATPPQPLATSAAIERAPATLVAGAPVVRRSAPLTALRRTIAQRLTQSTQDVPQFNVSVDVDMTRLLAVVDDWKQTAKPDSPKVTVTAVLVKVCAWALGRNPAINAAFLGDRIDEYASINIGVAVAIDDGLIVPVIHDADKRALPDIATALADLSARARANKLGTADIQGGTFSISNLGMFAVDRFTAIVNPPQAAILAVGRASKRFIPGPNDQPVAAMLSTLSVSADHRAVDGAVVGRFLSDLQQGVERPGLLL
jgi:pyruvate dehydrogenase E2 component (dihydrolipoamide acetyltransferase)